MYQFRENALPSKDVPLVGVEKVDMVVKNHFNLDFVNIPNKKKEVVTPRQIYIYCLYVFTDLPLKSIAMLAGKKDHSTIIHSVRVVRDTCCYNENYRKEIIHIESMIE